MTVNPGHGSPVSTMTQAVLCTEGAESPAGTVSSSAASKKVVFGGTSAEIVYVATWPMVRIGSSTDFTRPLPATTTVDGSVTL